MDSVQFIASLNRISHRIVPTQFGHSRFVAALVIAITVTLASQSLAQTSEGTSPPSDVGSNGFLCIAQHKSEFPRFYGPNPMQFGYVESFGDLLVVGRPSDNTFGPNFGAVYVYRYQGSSFVEEAVLSASVGSPYSKFGEAIDVFEDLIVVGARWEDAPSINSGAVYVFRNGPSGWVEEARIVPDQVFYNAEFGSAVSVFEGGVVAAGRTINGSSFVGKVYVFENSTGSWEQETLLQPNDLDSADGFGQVLATQGDTIFVAAPYDDTNAYQAGSVYVFKNTLGSWSQVDELYAQVVFEDAKFGRSIDVSGDWLVVGSPEVYEFFGEQGSIYFYHWDGFAWTEYTRINQPEPRSFGYFGQDVAIVDNHVVAVAINDSTPDHSRSAYLYQFSNGQWQGHARLSAPYLSASIVTIANEFVVVNSYMFGGFGHDCNSTGISDLCDIALGLSADCNENWIPAECELAAGTSFDVNTNGVPDECEIDCNANNVPDDCDISCDALAGRCQIPGCGGSTDCNVNLLPDDCELAAGSALDCNSNSLPDECEPDCNANGVQDECDVANGFSIDCQDNRVPDECELEGNDCNETLVPDDCELQHNDCDSNGVPDECDPDCNTNGVADGCDLTGGTSLDCNGDSVPDECPEVGHHSHSILSPASFTGGSFGYELSVSGDWAIVSGGANAYDTIDGLGATILRAADTGWEIHTVLTNPTDTEGSGFGTAVAIEGDIAVIGAPFEWTSHCVSGVSCVTGTAYVYRLIGSSWLLEQTLELGNGDYQRGFGYDILIDDGRVAVSTLVRDGWSFPAVAIFNFDGSQWSEESRAVPTWGFWIADASAMEDNTLIVGNPHPCGASGGSGRANILERQGQDWVEQDINSTGLLSGACGYGSSVALEGDVAVIGNPYEAEVDVLQRVDGTWMLVDTLRPSFDSQFMSFGAAVAIHGNIIAVGAPGADGDFVDQGAIFFSESDGAKWNEIQVLYAPPDGSTRFGESLAIVGDLIVSGAPGTIGDDHGAVYFLSLTTDCNANSVPDECELSTYPATDCDDDGVIDQCAIRGLTRRDCNFNDQIDTCELLLAGDHDGDYDIDLNDAAHFIDCMTEPCNSEPCMAPTYGNTCCALSDMDEDGDVDLLDYATLQRAYTGVLGLDCNRNGKPDATEYGGPDIDGDFDIDLADYAYLHACMTQPCGTPLCSPPLFSDPCCRLADFDREGDVDLGDYATATEWFTGADMVDCNHNGIADAGETWVLGDVNGSGLIDLVDWHHLAECVSAPCPVAACEQVLYRGACCRTADLDDDGDVDLVDFAAFARVFSTGGPDN